MKRFALTLWVLIFLSGCLPVGWPPGPGGGAATAQVSTVVPEVGTAIIPGGTPPPPATPTPIPTLEAGMLGPTVLKYRLLDEFPLFYCDPDEYPVARGDEQDKARERFPEIQANAEAFETIVARLGLEGTTSFSDEQKLQIYREYKRLAAIQFEAEGKDRYRFQFQSAQAEGNGELLNGIIDGKGRITIQERQPGIVTCPICLAAGSQIDTPAGPIAVENLRAGDLVWTLTSDGRRAAAPLLLAARAPAPTSHRVVHLLLEDGRELWASPGHPTASGRPLADLAPGDALDGARVMTAALEPYTAAFTYDILPAGDTGLYWANGVLLGSTLR